MYSEALSNCWLFSTGQNDFIFAASLFLVTHAIVEVLYSQSAMIHFATKSVK